MNYALIDKDSVRTFEASANHVEEYVPAQELNRIWHTNHPMVNQNYCREIQMWDRLTDLESANTHSRMDYLQREMSMADKPFTVTRAKELLASREVPVSSQAEDDFPTINGLLMEFSKQPTLYFAPGPPSQHDFVPFQFD